MGKSKGIRSVRLEMPLLGLFRASFATSARRWRIVSTRRMPGRPFNFRTSLRGVALNKRLEYDMCVCVMHDLTTCVMVHNSLGHVVAWYFDPQSSNQIENSSTSIAFE